jgi:circadian clock protein KaiC
LIDEKGISIAPITSLTLDYPISTKRVPTGIPRLDTMLGGKGFYSGSTILVSGTAGTGKTSIAALFANATCQRGERCLFFAFEESPSQIIRNMGSIGINLEQYVKKGLLQIKAVRSTLFGLEMHLVQMQKLIDDFKPSSVVIDPITNLIIAGDETEVKSMLARLIDYMKNKQATAMFTSLTHMESLERTEAEVSSIMDTWILLRDIEIGGERNRGIYILKSRGMAHSNQIREFLITSKGVDIVDVYTGPAGVLTGSARLTQEALEKAAADLRRGEIERMQRDLEHQRKLMEAQVATLQSEFAAKEEEVRQLVTQESRREKTFTENRTKMGWKRKADKESPRT